MQLMLIVCLKNAVLEIDLLGERGSECGGKGP